MQTAQQTFAATLSADKKLHQAAWSRIENHIRACAPKGAKIFEIHHAIEHARKLYFVEMEQGQTAQSCEQIMMRVIVSGRNASSTGAV